jgi:hypothetical protein
MEIRKLSEVLISKANLGNPAFDMESLLGPACSTMTNETAALSLIQRSRKSKYHLNTSKMESPPTGGGGGGSA